ncbi:MAG: hypothetical protein Kow0069_29010 [Promethearchaeota archaeon]
MKIGPRAAAPRGSGPRGEVANDELALKPERLAKVADVANTSAKESPGQKGLLLMPFRSLVFR